MSFIDARRVLPSAFARKPYWSWDFAARQVIPPGSTYSSASGRWVTNGADVPPINWTIGSRGGPASQIVSFGIASGIDYIDIRMFGTISSTGGYIAVFEINSVITLSPGTTWIESAYLTIVGGSLANVGVINFDMVAYPGGNDNGAPDFKASLSSTLKRLLSSPTINTAGRSYIQPRISFSATNGAAIDFTLRIGLPQMEQAAFASSPIKTSGSAVARAADFLPAPLASLRGWNPSQGGVLVLECTLLVYLGAGVAQYGATMRGSGPGYVLLRVNYFGGTSANFYGAGVNHASPNTTVTPVAGLARRMAFGRSPSQVAVAVNSGTPTVIDGTFTLPANLNIMFIGSDSSTPGDVCVKRFAYYADQRFAAFIQRVSR